MARAKKGRFASDALIDGIVASLTQEGDGIVPAVPRELRVPGALRGEHVRVKRSRRDRAFDLATLVQVVEPSADRVEPACAFASLCSGCNLHHLRHDMQLIHKQAYLRTCLAKHGVSCQSELAPLVGQTLGYRRRARLAVRWVEKKGRVLVGFREQQDSRFVATIDRCVVLDPRVGALLPELSNLVASLDLVRQVPQIEVACGDDNVALVVRVLAPCEAADRQRLQAFAALHHLEIWLAANPPAALERLDDVQNSGLWYAIDESWPPSPAQPYPLRLAFTPRDFVQVNASVNRAMIEQALHLLAVEAHHHVLDLFCGLGNFTLPLARRCAAVLGVEGDHGLVARAQQNATDNGLSTATFERRDLYGDLGDATWLLRSFDRVLLDPPRSGAAAIVESLAQSDTARIVYVSCNPETLARDAALLCQGGQYRLETAGIMDMFPHTAHVEAMALFVRNFD